MQHEIKNNPSYRLIGRMTVVLLAITMLFTACKKEEDTIALIKIVNVLGEPVGGATVKLYAEPTITEGQEQGELIQDVIQLTDARGEATFDFTEQYEEGQAGFAVLNIEAFKDSVDVEGIIRIDPEVVNEETLILQ